VEAYQGVGSPYQEM
jgi:hypothetical protein